MRSTIAKLALAVLVLAFGQLGILNIPVASASQVDMLIEKLVEKKILTRLDAEAIRADIETAEKKDFKAQVKSSTPWLDGLTSKGDVRLRYEAFEREDEDASDRNRFRFRIRWGLEKKLNDDWRAGFRIASSEDRKNPTSTNQTLDEEFSFKQVFFDRAYAKFTPNEAWKNVIPAVNNVEIGGGKVENPYDRDKWNTTIIWDSDVTPEGLYEQVDFRLATPGEDAYWDLNTLMGQWIVDEDSDLKPGDHEMYSYGVGTTYQWKKNHKTSFKFTYYDWQDYAQFIKSSSGVPDNLGGNDREVEDFKIINFYADVNFEVPTPFWGTQNLTIFGDYANNVDLQDGGSTDETLRNPALRGDSGDAFSAGATLGKAKDPGTWAFTYEYYYVEPNAVVGNFSESDLGLGFTNNKGHKLSWKYMILKDLELSFTTWLVERIDKTILTYGNSGLRPRGDDDEILRTQLDLVYKF
jgi:hypothetical protein